MVACSTLLDTTCPAVVARHATASPAKCRTAVEQGGAAVARAGGAARILAGMATVLLGVAALLAWAAFELVFRSPGAASSWRGDARNRASTPLLVLAFALAAVLPVALR